VTVVAAALGWLGAGALLAAFGLLERARLRPGSRSYLALNLFGSAGLAVASGAVGAWPSASLNAVWLVIGLISVVRPPRSRPSESIERST
jgi:hypothetical protein